MAAALLGLTGAASAALPAATAFTYIGDVYKSSSPGGWQAKELDVGYLLGNGAVAKLSFEFSNDLLGSGSTSTNRRTQARLYFVTDADGYYLNFEYFFPEDRASGSAPGLPPADSSAHLRDMSITIDGVKTRDQFGAFNDHLGGFHGAAWDGWYDGFNVLGQTGFESRTYVMSTSAVPEPASAALLLASLLSIARLTRRRASNPG